jgi:putative acetyltransferase
VRGAPERFRIRPAVLADAPAIARVMRAAVRGNPSPDYSARQRAAWSSLPALYHRWAMGPGGERYLVAERRGRVVAYAARREDEITAAFVHPAAARAGVGRALVERLAGDAVREGRRRLKAAAALPALGFYAALGFRAAGGTRVPLPGGGVIDAVLVVRRSSGPRGR